VENLKKTQMKVIALKGDENTGKSHTINVVYSFLVRDGYKQVPGHFEILGNKKFQDIFDILTKEGLTVGIIGMGDYERTYARIDNLLYLMESKFCDVVLCACRNKPKIIENIQHKYSSVIWVDKTNSKEESENRIVNVFDADRMIQLI
jgi:hypothetical protein